MIFSSVEKKSFLIFMVPIWNRINKKFIFTQITLLNGKTFTETNSIDFRMVNLTNKLIFNWNSVELWACNLINLEVKLRHKLATISVMQHFSAKLSQSSICWFISDLYEAEMFWMLPLIAV